MKNCPDPITWQAILDGEENGKEYVQHLERCPQCQEMYQEIQGAVDLAGGLFTGSSLPKDFAQRLAAKTRPFPAGLLTAALFFLLTLSVLMFDPRIFHWWLTVGFTAQCGLLIDIVLEVIKAAQRMSPAWWLTLAAVVAALEIVLLTKLKTAEE